MCLNHSFAVIGGDARQRCLAQQLRAQGRAVSVYRVPGMDDSPGGLSGSIRDADVLILPMPALESADSVRSADGGIPLAALPAAASPGTLICGGMLGAAVPALRGAGLRVFDYAEDETLLLENAELTAEAALRLLLTHLPKPLMGSQIRICGFGRIGRLLARKLAALGAHVTVAARSREAHALCHILGYPSENTAHLPALSRFDAVVNTVPACILPDAAGARPDCMLLELASSPGGFGEAARAHPGYVPARGLPGIYAPRAAAACIRDMILQTLSPEERL